MNRIYFLTTIFFFFVSGMAAHGQSFQDFYNGLPSITIPYNFSDEGHTSNTRQSLPLNLQNQHDDYSSFNAVGKIDLESGYYFVLIKKESSSDGAEVYILISIDSNENIKSSLVVNIEHPDGKGTDFKIESDKTLRVAYYGDNLIQIMDYTYGNGLLNSDPNMETISFDAIESM